MNWLTGDFLRGVGCAEEGGDRSKEEVSIFLSLLLLRPGERFLREEFRVLCVGGGGVVCASRWRWRIDLEVRGAGRGEYGA